MAWLYQSYRLALLAAAALALVAAYLATRRRAAPWAASFGALMAALAGWSIFYAAPLTWSDTHLRLLFLKLYMSCVILVPLSWIVVTLHYAGHASWLTLTRRHLLAVVPLASLLLVWTNDYHRLFWPRISLVVDHSLIVAQTVTGPAFWVHAAYSYLLLLAGALLLVRRALRAWPVYRRQGALLLLGILLPLAANAVYLSGLGPLGELDITPLAFTVTALLAAWSVLRAGFLDIVPVAHDAVFAGLADAVIVLDAAGRVVDLNPAAGRLLGDRNKQIIGHPAAEVFAIYPEMVDSLTQEAPQRAEVAIIAGEQERFFDLSVTPLGGSRGRPAGSLIALRDVTNQRRARQALQESEARYRALYSAAERQSQELSLLNEVRTALARQLDLSTLLRTTVEAIARAFGYTQVSVYLLEEGDLVLEHQVGYGASAIESIPIATGVSGRAARTGSPVWLPDVRTDPDYLPAVEGVVSEISIPLKEGGRVAGVLNVESVDGMVLTEADLRLMMAVAEQVEIALERTRLYAEARANEEALRQAHARLEERVQERTRELLQATRRLEALHELDQATLALQPVEEIARIALAHLRQVIDCDLANAVSFDNRSGPPRFLAYVGDLHEASVRPADGREPQAPPPTVLPDEMLVIEDTWAAADSQQAAHAAGRGVRSYITVPLICETHILGLLNLGRARPGAFSPEEMTIAQEIADQLALALHQSQLRIAQARYAVELEEQVALRTAELALTAQRLQAANDHLEELSQHKSQFVSNVSHELRTPLANIKLYLSLLEHGKPDKHAHYMATLKRETELLQRLIEDLLSLSRLDLGKVQPVLQPVDLNALVGTLVADRAALIANRGLVLEADIDSDLPQVEADAKMIVQVLTNLMTNAANYTPAGGRICLATAGRTSDGRAWATVTVQDTGPGIAVEEQARVFERFYRGNEARRTGVPGTGLGLAICQELVARHHGRLTLDSVVGQGSSFTVWLPLGRADGEACDCPPGDPQGA